MSDRNQDELAQDISEYPPVDEDGNPIEAVLTRFVLLSEWMDAEGNDYLTMSHASGSGGSLSPWETKGMLYEALFGFANFGS